MKYTGMKRRSYKSITPLRKLQEIYLYFFLYCVIGWLYEVFLEAMIYRWGFSNRGILFGPYLPIYGIGALVLLLCFGRYVQKPAKRGPAMVASGIGLFGMHDGGHGH